MQLPPGFTTALPQIVAAVEAIPGYLTKREIEFLALLAACPTAEGAIVELGTLYGKSTAALARGAALAGGAEFYSVDLRPRAETPGHLEGCGVAQAVQLVGQASAAFWADFDRPIRLFWHDGANRKSLVEDDIRAAVARLADGAIVAFHDVLNPSGERLHPFVDAVLADSRFGKAGVVGSIGWARFRRAGCSIDEAEAKSRLSWRLSNLKPFHGLPAKKPRGLRKVVYEVCRQLVPHGAVRPERWLRMVA
jgi:predicted O-methyltransferase YrrM